MVTYVERPDLDDRWDDTVGPVWPEFILHGATVNELWPRLYEIAPEHQFFVIDPDTGQGWSLRLEYVRSETTGPLFERMSLRIEAIALYCGLKGIFKLRAADVYRVLSIDQVAEESGRDRTSRGAPADQPDPVFTVRALQDFSARINSADSLESLVDSILASVRVVPEDAASVTAVDVEAAVAEVVQSLRPLLGHHQVAVAGAPHLHALADPPRLRQIIEHLVENAVKYAPADTTISVDWSLIEGVVHLGVSDEGPGIPDEWRERIFEPYARRDTHTARGSGIGLYAAKRLGESMGAHLWCEPARPNGARFVVALPAAVAL